MQLVEEAVEGCWIGYRARLPLNGTEIGSVYAPPKQDPQGATSLKYSQPDVETVIRIEARPSVRHFVSSSGTEA